MNMHGPDVLPQFDLSAGESLDDLGTVSLTVDRLRRFFTDPTTPAEDAEAVHRLDGILGLVANRT